jgi:hypothetical protein
VSARLSSSPEALLLSHSYVLFVFELVSPSILALFQTDFRKRCTSVLNKPERTYYHYRRARVDPAERPRTAKQSRYVPWDMLSHPIWRLTRLVAGRVRFVDIGQDCELGSTGFDVADDVRSCVLRCGDDAYGCRSVRSG